VVLTFSELKQQVRDVLDRTGLTAIIGAENIFPSDKAALAELTRRLAKPVPAGPISEEGTGATQTGAAATLPHPAPV
jgi:hypothetical protein